MKKLSQQIIRHRVMLVALLSLFACFSLHDSAFAQVDAEATIASERLKEILAGTRDPETTADLKAFEAHVKKLVERVSPMTVGVVVGEAAGSGVIVSNDGYVLTAGHVSMKPNLDATIILPENDRGVKAKTLGVNNAIDSGMMKITEEGSWPYLEMGTSADLKKGQWIIAMGHPGGYEIGRKPVLRLGRILTTGPGVIRTDCVLIGGDSGGPLINMDGQVIGIHSRINEKVTSNYHVPIDTYSETWDRLAKGELWGRTTILQGVRPFLGFKLELDSLTIKEVTADGPAAKAGIQVGDTLVEFADRKIDSSDALRIILIGLMPGQKVKVVVLREQKEVSLELEVGQVG